MRPGRSIGPGASTSRFDDRNDVRTAGQLDAAPAVGGAVPAPAARLGILLTPPILWLVVVYLGSLAVMFVSSLWRLDPATSAIVRDPSLANFQDVFSADKPYLGVAAHTVTIAAVVTLADALIAFPLAYYMARVATGRQRRILFILATLPLWISYLVRVYSWRTILAEEGFLNWTLGFFGLSGPGPLGDLPIAIVFTYIWLPYMILPLYAGLERIPTSLVEASSDLGGRAWTTFRRIVLPLAFPGLVAGSIFTFSLDARATTSPRRCSPPTSSSATWCMATWACRATSRSRPPTRRSRSRWSRSTWCSRADSARSRHSDDERTARPGRAADRDRRSRCCSCTSRSRSSRSTPSTIRATSRGAT